MAEKVVARSHQSVEERVMAKQQKHLIKSVSPKAVSKNIRYEMRKHPGMSQKQAVAIALETQRQARKKK